MECLNNEHQLLLADATRSTPANGSSAQRCGYNHTNVPGGFYKHHASPHLKRRFPQAGNLGFKDGHTGWRKFDLKEQRAASGQSFWWRRR